MSSRSRTLWPILPVVALVICWCSFQVIGSWRHGPYRGLILAGCSLFFLGLWASGLFLFARRDGRDTNQLKPDGTRWNRTCVTSFGLALAGTVAALPCLTGWAIGPASGTGPWLFVALTGLTLAVLTAIVGLSNPFVRRGKRLGLAALALVGILLVASCARLFG